MATNEEPRDFSPADGWGHRLRDAWQVLFGRSAVAGSLGHAPAAGRGLSVPQAALIQQLIDGLPAAAIVLEREGRVIAFNEAAARIAPALRRGEPALIALRTPEVVNAIRRATKRREPQRVEFFER